MFQTKRNYYIITFIVVLILAVGLISENKIGTKIHRDDIYLSNSSNTLFSTYLSDYNPERIDPIWKETFEGDKYGEAFNVVQTDDDGYIISGTTSCGSSKILLIKTNETGNIEWEKTYGDKMLHPWGISVQQTNDGGYIIGGETRNQFIYELWILKIDSEGEEQWNKSYGGINYQWGALVKQTSDGGYIIVGFFYTDYVHLIKTDAFGNTIWSTNLGIDNRGYGDCLQETSDGGFIVVGRSIENGVVLCKTYMNGSIVWKRTFNGKTDFKGNTVQQTRDGGYIISGGENKKVGVIKTDSSGIEEWNQTFAAGTSYSIRQNPDEGYIITGKLYGHLGLLKIDLNGNEKWNKSYIPEEYSSTGRSIILSSDGGYVIAGTLEYKDDNCDIILLKTDSEGGNGEPINEINDTVDPLQNNDVEKVEIVISWPFIILILTIIFGPIIILISLLKRKKNTE